MVQETLPAGVAAARDLRRLVAVPGVALPHRHQRLPRRPAPPGRAGATDATFAEVPWLQPYPDRLLDEIAAPADRARRRRSWPARPSSWPSWPPCRCCRRGSGPCCCLRDVLGLTGQRDGGDARHVGRRGQQRAAAGPGHPAGPPARAPADWSTTDLTAEERTVLARFIDAHERNDAEAAIALARHDMRITMPPRPMVFEGIDVIVPFIERRLRAGRAGDWRLVPTRANRMPTAASYLRAWGDTEFRAFKFDVLRVDRRRHRGDHDVRRRPVPRLRPARGPGGRGAAR